MHNIKFNLTKLHNHNDYFWGYLQLRKHFFVDQLGWDIPHDNQFEMDQYDTPMAWYSLVVDKGKVVGGARVMPTTARWGQYSYMLKDAVDGKLSDIPAAVLAHAEQSQGLWECTRLVISDDLNTHAQRSKCLSLIVSGLAETAASQGGTELISLSPITLMRALRQLGYDAGRIGEPYVNPGDGRKYAVLSMPVTRGDTEKAA